MTLVPCASIVGDPSRPLGGPLATAFRVTPLRQLKSRAPCRFLSRGGLTARRSRQISPAAPERLATLTHWTQFPGSLRRGGLCRNERLQPPLDQPNSSFSGERHGIQRSVRDCHRRINRNRP